MKLLRAGAISVLILAILAAAGLTGFGSWFASYDRGDIIERTLLWFGISLIGFAPVGLIVFPLIHLIGNTRGQMRPFHFAVVGAICGGLITGFALWRFRPVLFGATVFAYAAVPLLLALGALAGFIGGYVFEWLARRTMTVAPQK